MSISGALANAVSGLRVASRSAEVVSSNIANASTEGYGRREIHLASDRGGVRVSGIDRYVDQGTIADRRHADAELGYSDGKAAFFTRMEAAVGVPDTPNSLTGRMADFEARLVAASAAPDNTNRLAAVVQSAKGVTNYLNGLSDKIMGERQTADAQIARSVDQVNVSLKNVADLNDKITAAIAVGQDSAALIDQRQNEIDKISGFVPIQEIPRQRGQVALMTANGTTLLDGRPAELRFSPHRTITADMTVEAGALSQIEVVGAGALVGMSGEALLGGSIAAQFEVRDVDTVALQSQIDAASRNLIEKFADPTLDATLTGGAPGLFTDTGGAADPLTEPGLAGRLQINAAVDPSKSGDLWRLRDGIAAPAEGPNGNNTLIEGYRATLDRAEVPATGTFAGARDSADLFADILSDVGFSRQTAQVRSEFAGDQQLNLKDLEQSTGVNTDQELQKLLLIERSYAANAKIIQAVDEMLQQLLRI